MAVGCHLENRYKAITAADDQIPMKFGMPVENHMPMRVKRSKIETGNRISIWRPFVLKNRK